MLTELWLSQRYLKARKERIISFTAFISMAGIGIGVFVLIVVIGVMSGFDRFLEDKMVGANAHMLLDSYKGETDPYGLIAKVKAVPHVVAAAPYVAGQAAVKIDKQLLVFEMRGIDPLLQPEVSRLREYVKQGTLELGDKELLAGEELAFRLGLKLGDKMTLISPATLEKSDYTVKGLFNSGMYQYDAGLLMANIKSAQDFFKLGTAVSGVSVKVDDVRQVDNIRESFYRSLPGMGNYTVRTWQDLNRNFLEALKLEKVVMFIVVTMTTVVAAFGIVSALIMSVMSKVKDIGILRSVGARTGSILSIFIFQGLSIGLVGIALGLGGGVAFCLSLNRLVDFISGLMGRSLIPKDIYYFDRIPVYISFADISAITVSALVIIFAASIYPAFFAARVNPAEAVRHE